MQIGTILWCGFWMYEGFLTTSDLTGRVDKLEMFIGEWNNWRFWDWRYGCTIVRIMVLGRRVDALRYSGIEPSSQQSIEPSIEPREMWIGCVMKPVRIY